MEHREMTTRNGGAPMPVEVDPAAIAELAAAVWRLHRKTPEGPVRRQVDGVCDALTALGVHVHEYEGLAYTAGLQLRVLAFQPTPGLGDERVTETVGPAVSLHGTLIRIGEVIVGIPEEAPTEGETS
jgi:hypothetical protein